MKRKFIKIVVVLIFLLGISNIKVQAAETKDNIQDGFYKICISTNKNKVLDVPGESTSQNIVIGMWSDNGGTNQKFKIEKQVNGNYKICALNSDLYLEGSGENIKQNKKQSNNMQEWVFEDAGNGYYYIKCVGNNMFLTEDGSSGLKAYNKDETKSQKFYLNKIANTKCDKVIPEGYYMIKSALNDKMVLDINGTKKVNEENVQLWSKNQGTTQIFELIYNEKENFYTIKSALSGKVLDLYKAGKKDCTNVELYSMQDVTWQKWVISETSQKNIYTINSVYSGLYLDLTGNVSNNGTNIEVYSGNGAKNQQFTFEKIDLPKSSKSVDDGFYEIGMASNTKMNVDILDASTKENALAGIWQSNGNANQRFKIRYQTNGYYSIENVNSGLFLEADGINVNQRSRDTKTTAQNWIIEKDGNNFYLISACNGLCVTTEGNTSLKMYKKSSSNSQKFMLYKKSNLVGTKILEDGYYVISSALNQNRAIDIEGASIESEANVILWGKSSRNNQKFKLKYDGNGYYTITSVKSGKVLDVAWAGKDNGSNVQQYSSSGNLWQKWIIEKSQDGSSYNIISALSGLYVDIPNSNTKEGTNIGLYVGNGGKNQRFIFDKTNAVEGTKTLESGYYKIQTKLNPSKVIDIGNFSKLSHKNISLYSSNNGYNQRFKITRRDNNCYIIQAVHSGKVLDISSNGKNVEQDDLTYEEEQEWIIKSAGNNSYNIISAHNGLCWNIESATDEKQVTIESGNSKTNQQFSFTKVTVETGTKTISDGTYQIVTALDNNKVVDITNSSVYAGANAEIWANNRGDNQKFKVTYQGNGYYKIVAVHSGKALSVEEAGSGELVNVIQDYNEDYLKSDWIIKSIGNGYYNIVSACNGLYLDVNGGNSNNGTNLEVYRKMSNNGQKFKFVVPAEVKLETGTYGVSGLKVKGDSRGSDLKYYKIGTGPNVFFATFAVHGFEDSWSYDGQELTKIAETFKSRLISMQDLNLADKWTIYIFPSVNPDGEYHGYTNNGPGRTSLYSMAPNGKGIDINRCWSYGYKRETSDRNYNGTESFQAYEARALRDFLLSKKATNGQTVLVDLHGWLNETIGDEWIGSKYRSKLGMSKHLPTYGAGYLVNWARTNLGSSGRIARSSLVELPFVSNSSQVSNWGLANKYIEATLEVLRQII